MGLSDALTPAVSGLNAQSFAMQNISGNIANSQTTAYKGIDTSFANMLPGDSVPTRQIAGGVIANSRATNNVQGTIQRTMSTTTWRSTAMAISSYRRRRDLAATSRCSGASTVTLKVIDTSSIMQLANGAYLDTKNNILILPDGTQIDTVTGLKVSTTA